MDIMDVIMTVEGDYPLDDETQDRLLAGIAEHKDTLRQLQGSWGRLVADLEEQGRI